MSIRIENSQLLNVQTVEAVVTGPDEANRLITVAGIARMNLGASTSTANTVVTKVETFTVLVGPRLTRRQFHKAIASVSLVGLSSEGPGSADWTVLGGDADWDDEAERVELRVELRVAAQVFNSGSEAVLIKGFGFQVTILAQL